MGFHNRKNIRKVFVAGFVLTGLLIPAASQAGSSPVVTVGDSSSGGVVNFAPPADAIYIGDGLASEIAAGDSPVFEISPGVTATVASLATAVNSGSLGNDQVASGFGSGGAAVTLSDASMANVQDAASASTVVVAGEAMTPLAVLLALSTSPDLVDLGVAMPGGVEVDLSASIANVAMALTSDNPTLVGTALNDASITFSRALRGGADSADLEHAAEALAVLLDAARQA